MTAGTPPPIVTGVDGSAESLDAVRWAARTARLRDAPLEIVHALDVSALFAGGVVPPPDEMVDALRARGRRALRTAQELAAAQGLPGAAAAAAVSPACCSARPARPSCTTPPARSCWSARPSEGKRNGSGTGQDGGRKRVGGKP